jgi:integrase
MDKATLEAMAMMKGEDLDDIIFNLTNTSVEELQDNYEHYMERTDQQKRDRNSLTKFIDWFAENSAEKIGEEEVEEFLRAMVRKGYSRSYVGQMYVSLKMFTRAEYTAMAAEQVESVDRSSVIKSEFKNSRSDEDNGRMGSGSRPITKHEIDEMLDSAPTLRTELMIRILEETGFRAKELAELEMADIDLSNRELTVDTAKRDDHRRTVKISVSLTHLLRKYIETDRPRYGRSSPFLFVSLKSDHPQPHNLARTLRDTADNAGIQDYCEMQNGAKRAEITPHSFRKYVAISMSEEGKGLKEIAEYLGHSNTASVDTYFDIQ